VAARTACPPVRHPAVLAAAANAGDAVAAAVAAAAAAAADVAVAAGPVADVSDGCSRTV